MTIDEFKNQMKEAANEFFTTTAKDAIVTGLRNTVLPAMRETSKPFIDKLQPWCYIRFADTRFHSI